MLWASSKDRQEQQDQNSQAVARAMNNLFGSIGAAGHHEKRRRNQRPGVSFAVLFFCCGKSREEIWAGTDMLLNFYSRPPERSMFSN